MEGCDDQGIRNQQSISFTGEKTRLNMNTRLSNFS
jgi:hypothetical protein